MKTPITQIQHWLKEAQDHPGIDLFDAACLSTVSPDGWPEGRIVLIKAVSELGITFFTNSLSRKGESLKQTPKAALTCYWEQLGRQLRMQGAVMPLSAEESDAYFQTRPRMSQIGAWASLQSESLSDRSVLLDRFDQYERQFDGEEVPRPPHWIGYVLMPHRVEFWVNGDFRLHHRDVFEKIGSAWQSTLLYP